MRALRDWQGNLNNTVGALANFGVDSKAITLIKYEALTPDSFIWFFNSKSAHYCLYAEDYIPSLQHVIDTIHNNLPSWNQNDTFRLIEVTNKQNWANTTPVRSADNYQQLADSAEIMRYATTSDIDFVFLAKSTYRPKTNLD